MIIVARLELNGNIIMYMHLITSTLDTQVDQVLVINRVCMLLIYSDELIDVIYETINNISSNPR